MAYIPDYIERKHGGRKFIMTFLKWRNFERYLWHYRLPGTGDVAVAKTSRLQQRRCRRVPKSNGKKQSAVLDKMKASLLRVLKRITSRNKLEKIWTDWEAFAQYAFNKSHSTCYALVAYQTAYLKAHYPSEYMAAVLESCRHY